MKSKLSLKYIAFALIMILTVSTMAGCVSDNSVETVKVTAVEATKGQIDSYLDLAGVLLPSQTISVAGKLSGEIVSAPFNVGDKVEKDQILFEVDTKGLDAQIEQAKAGQVSAKAAYELAKSQIGLIEINLNTVQKAYNDTKALYDSGSASQSQLDDVKSKLDTVKKQYENAKGAQMNQASAAITSANAAVNTLLTQRENAVVKSPITGIVVTKNVQLGELASPGVPMASVADLSTLSMKGTVSQEYIPFLSVGQEVEMSVDIYSDKSYPAVVTVLGPMSVSTGKIFPIELSMSNTEGLMAGLTSKASIHLKGNSNIIVPAEAVLDVDADSYVFVIEEGVAVKKSVVTGLKNREQIEILSGVTEGEKIAVTNTHVLQDQMTVEVTDSNN